jgi:hypothetical protein
MNCFKRIRAIRINWELIGLSSRFESPGLAPALESVNDLKGARKHETGNANGSSNSTAGFNHDRSLACGRLQGCEERHANGDKCQRYELLDGPGDQRHRSLRRQYHDDRHYHLRYGPFAKEKSTRSGGKPVIIGDISAGPAMVDLARRRVARPGGRCHNFDCDDQR